MRHLTVYDARLAEPEEFVRFWAARYRYNAEYLYDNHIGKPLTRDSIRDLYTWKNGGKMSRLKAASVERNYVSRLGELRRLPVDMPPDAFLSRFADGGSIWRIFWLHCWQHRRYPIYDQHVHRAMVFIRTGRIEEIGSRDVIDRYLSEYLPFHAEFDGLDWKMVDRCLWSYGKFLKSYHFGQVGDGVGQR